LKKSTIPEVSETTLKLEEYLRSLPAGERVSYAEIEMATGVQMTTSNKARLRIAAKRSNRIYATIRGFGLEMSSGQNAGSINRHGLVRVDNAVRRQEKVGNLLLAQHAAEMPVGDRHQITAVVCMFAQIRVIADAQKRMMRLRSKNRPKSLPKQTPDEVLSHHNVP